MRCIVRSNPRPRYGKHDMTDLQSTTHNNRDREIDLIELIEAFRRSKWLILGGSLLCASAMGIWTYFTPRQYASESLILVSPPIVKSGTNEEDGAQISEIVLSSLDPSTYKVLAKSDELIFVLADTLRNKLSNDMLIAIGEQTDTYSLASNLMKDLEVQLLQDTGQLNERSDTPLLLFRYQSSKKSLPSLVVNTWSELFLQRNQGLSSNITDSFYGNVVRQYEQAKENLEQKEDELAKLNTVSSKLKRIQKETAIKSARLDATLEKYHNAQASLEEKSQEYKYVKNALKQTESNGRWLGFLHPDSLNTKNEDKESPRYNLITLVKDIDSLSRDSTLIRVVISREKLEMDSKHRVEKGLFEKETEFTLKQIRSIVVDSVLTESRSYKAKAKEKIDFLNAKRKSFKKTLATQEKFFITRKAITDNALWENTSDNERISQSAQQALSNTRLVSEQINPAYATTSDSLSHYSSKLYLLVDQVNLIDSRLDSLQNISVTLHEELAKSRHIEQELYKRIENEKSQWNNRRKRVTYSVETNLKIKRDAFEMHREQYVELQYRKAELEIEINELSLSTSYFSNNYLSWREELSTLSVQLDSLDLMRRRIERDASVYEESFDRISKMKEEARIARDQAAGDIQVVSSAQISTPQSKGTVRVALLVGAVYFLLCTLMIFTRQAFSTSSLKRPKSQLVTDV